MTSPADAPPDPVEEHFRAQVQALRDAPRQDPTLPLRAGTSMSGSDCVALFTDQATSRHLDRAARWLKEVRAGYYTIGSSGHESNAIVATALRPTDPALLHYRSGGFYLARARQVPGHDGVRDVLLGLVASTDEPISGGRHKVFGHPALAVIPQTSTIASHLPRALGVAFAVERARKLSVVTPWPSDAVVVCSFGDASANHSTAAGAINAASWCEHHGLPLPLLFVCEDNGIGISVRTPAAWIESAYGARSGVHYVQADGGDPVATWDAAHHLASWVRRERRPGFLHLRTVRFFGHAGSDVESAYRSVHEIGADLGRDPLLGTARALVNSGVLGREEVLARYDQIGRAVMTAAADVQRGPRHTAVEEITRPIAPRSARAVAALAATAAPHDERLRAFGGRLPETEQPLTLAQTINRTLIDAAAVHPGLIVFGEDVAAKGGVYGVTRGLQGRLGSSRVFDTLLDEQTILGVGLGAGLSGLLPVPEIQYLAYLHNAADQIRGEAATLQFFSQGQYRNPMVVRIAGLGYQLGFGGHFHNDNAVAALRDIPGLVIAVPARATDAAPMLRTCLAAAVVDGSVCIFLEPIARYHTRDLHDDGDGEWLASYRDRAGWALDHVPIGRARTYGDGCDLTIVTMANGVYLSLRAARRLAAAGWGVRIVDLRWIAPLPTDDLLREARATGRVLVVDETRRTGGLSEAVITALVDNGFAGRMARVTSADSFIPLGDAAEVVLVSEDQIVDAAGDLLNNG